MSLGPDPLLDLRQGGGTPRSRNRGTGIGKDGLEIAPHRSVDRRFCLVAGACTGIADVRYASTVALWVARGPTRRWGARSELLRACYPWWDDGAVGTVGGGLGRRYGGVGSGRRGSASKLDESHESALEVGCCVRVGRRTGLERLDLSLKTLQLG